MFTPLISVLLLALDLFIGSAHTEEKEPPWKAIVSNAMGVKINYPPGWEMWGEDEGDSFDPNSDGGGMLSKPCFDKNNMDCGTVVFNGGDVKGDFLEKVKRVGFEKYARDAEVWSDKDRTHLSFELKKLRNGTWMCSTVRDNGKFDKRVSIRCYILNELKGGRKKYVVAYFTQQNKDVALAIRAEQNQVKKTPEHIASKDLFVGTDWSEVPKDITELEKLSLKDTFYQILDKIEVLNKQESPAKK